METPYVIAFVLAQEVLSTIVECPPPTFPVPTDLYPIVDPRVEEERAKAKSKHPSYKLSFIGNVPLLGVGRIMRVGL